MDRKKLSETVSAVFFYIIWYEKTHHTVGYLDNHHLSAHFATEELLSTGTQLLGLAAMG